MTAKKDKLKEVKEVEEVEEVPKPAFCEAVGLKTWHANFGGKIYEIRTGERIVIGTEEHFVKLSGRFVNAVKALEA